MFWHMIGFSLFEDMKTVNKNKNNNVIYFMKFQFTITFKNSLKQYMCVGITPKGVSLCSGIKCMPFYVCPPLQAHPLPHIYKNLVPQLSVYALYFQVCKGKCNTDKQKVLLGFQT